MSKEIYEIGEIPPLGEIPKKMYAWTLRNERLGEPIDAFKVEKIDIPKLGKEDVLVFNMSSGINYNGVWAALGKPQNAINLHGKYEEKQDFLICGCESSGIVYAVGEDVTDVKVGDEVICIGIQFDNKCPVYQEFKDPRVSPSFRIWGYEGNWGSFAQFSKVQEQQCVKKPKELSWEVAASCVATGATIYNMLTHWKGNEIKRGDVVLVWGGYGGLGSSAIPLIRELGGIPVAVVSSDERGEECIKMGAQGFVNRKNFEHWGAISNDLVQDKTQYIKWVKNVIKFRKSIWKAAGIKKDPRIIIEHPGSDTLPTSIFVCDKKGMVVICGATSGYVGTLDLRHLWLGTKRLQGSHAALTSDVINYLKILAHSEKCQGIRHVYKFKDIAELHQAMYENRLPRGNIVVNINEI